MVASTGRIPDEPLALNLDGLDVALEVVARLDPVPVKLCVQAPDVLEGLLEQGLQVRVTFLAETVQALADMGDGQAQFGQGEDQCRPVRFPDRYRIVTA